MAETKTSSIHTPTPWELTSESSSRYGGFNRIIKADGMWLAIVVDDATCDSENTEKETQANAEFIVRAVNCHQELLDAAKDLIHEAKLHDLKYCNDALNKLERAIQRAESGALRV